MFPLRSRSRSQAGIDLDSAPQKVSCLDAVSYFYRFRGRWAADKITCLGNTPWLKLVMNVLGYTTSNIKPSWYNLPCGKLPRCRPTFFLRWCGTFFPRRLRIMLQIWYWFSNSIGWSIGWDLSPQPWSNIFKTCKSWGKKTPYFLALLTARSIIFHESNEDYPHQDEIWYHRKCTYHICV